KTLGVDKPFLLDLHLEPFGECVYNRHSDSVKPPGYFVCGRFELSACMKFGKHDLRCCPSFRVSGMEPCGYAPSVVNDSAAAVVVDEDLYQCAVSCKRLINTVVDYFVNKVVKAVNTGGADIHCRPLSNSIKALKDFYVFSSVRAGYFFGLYVFHHSPLLLAVTFYFLLGFIAASALRHIYNRPFHFPL